MTSREIVFTWNKNSRKQKTECMWVLKSEFYSVSVKTLKHHNRVLWITWNKNNRFFKPQNQTAKLLLIKLDQLNSREFMFSGFNMEINVSFLLFQMNFIWNFCVFCQLYIYVFFLLFIQWMFTFEVKNRICRVFSLFLIVIFVFYLEISQKYYRQCIQIFFCCPIVYLLRRREISR